MKKVALLRTGVISSALLVFVVAGLTTSVYAAPPARPGNMSRSATVKYTGATEFSESASEAGKNYTTSDSKTNSILALAGTINLSSPTITKSGDDNGDDADFYGTNAAVLSKDSAKIKLTDGTVTTDGKHANGVFAYGDSTIELNGTKITTKADNSGAVMVTGGGTLKATNVVAETSGNSSAPIRSDRGGGTMAISGGSYTSNGVGSPAIYSTADVTVKDGAKLKSNASEGAVIEGSNSITLDHSELTASNTELNGNSETYKAVFIYQSMSGDAKEGTGNFTMKDTKLTNKKGDIFFVTNTNAVINLSKNTIVNEDNTGALLRSQAGKWGRTGQNGGNTTLTSEDEELNGDIVLDNLSTADISFKNKTSYTGTINGANTAKNIKITLDNDSRIVLAGDSYISELDNSESTNSNIYANGHKLYVNGEEISINQETPPEWKTENETTSEQVKNQAEEDHKQDKTILYVALVVFGVAFVAALISVIHLIRRQNKARKINQYNAEKRAVEEAKKNQLKRPWEESGKKA